MKAVVAAVCLIFSPLAVTSPADLSSPVDNYIEIEKTYFLWKDGMFGSRNYHRRVLLSVLRKLIRKTVETMPDYAVARKKDGAEKRLKGIFSYKSGITVDVEIGPEGMKNMKIDSSGVLWYSGSIVSIRGELRRFYLAPYPGNDDLILFFDDAQIVFADKETYNE